MSLPILRALYPNRFAYAQLQPEPGKDTVRVPLAPLWREDDDDDLLEPLGDNGIVRAAAANPKRQKDIDALKKLSETETKSVRESSGDMVQRKRALQTIVSRTHAKELMTDEMREHAASLPEEVRRGWMHQTTEIVWQRNQVRAIEHMSSVSPLVDACIKTLKNQVMSEGIKFMRGNVELVPSATFSEYIENKLKPFAYQCIETLLQIGVIPVVYELDRATGQVWPYVPKLGTYALYVQRIRGATKYRFFWTDENTFSEAWRRQQIETRDGVRNPWTGQFGYLQSESAGGYEDPTVEILHNLGYDLSSNGSVTSKCSTALACVFERLQAIRRRATAESLLTSPTIATEYNHDAEARDAANFSTGYYVSATSAPTSTDMSGDAASITSLRNRAFKRDSLQMQTFANALCAYEEETGRDAAAEFGIPADAFRADAGGTAVTQPGLTNADGQPAIWRNQYHFSSTRRPVELPRAQLSGDFLGYLDHLDHQICSIFGVPRTYLQGDAIKAGTDLVSERFAAEVKALRSTTGQVLTYIYNKLFFTEDADSLAQAVVSRGAADTSLPITALLTEEDLYVSEAIRRVKVTFPEPAVEDPERLQQAYAFGAIDDKKFHAELLRRAGFDPEQACCVESELPTEARHFLIPQLADYYKTKMQRDQMEAQQKLAVEQQKTDAKLAHEQLVSNEKVAIATAKAAAVVDSKSDGGGGSGGGGGEKKRKAEKSSGGDTKRSNTD